MPARLRDRCLVGTDLLPADLSGGQLGPRHDTHHRGGAVVRAIFWPRLCHRGHDPHECDPRRDGGVGPEGEPGEHPRGRKSQGAEAQERGAKSQESLPRPRQRRQRRPHKGGDPERHRGERRICRGACGHGRLQGRHGPHLQHPRQGQLRNAVLRRVPLRALQDEGAEGAHALDVHQALRHRDPKGRAGGAEHHQARISSQDLGGCGSECLHGYVREGAPGGSRQHGRRAPGGEADVPRHTREPREGGLGEAAGLPHTQQPQGGAHAPPVRHACGAGGRHYRGPPAQHERHGQEVRG
mmetsp:Transcript_34737/g.108020  ORF Transcript_34737/g.108020 Transcript_34737/m.108020 type:complete len:297 (+) Transcript_34737:617-1507(+)